MARYNKQEDFESGIAIVSPFFVSRGYSLTILDAFTDKEGVYYSARFSRSIRAVSFTHLYSLSAITYTLGDAFIEHTAYTAALGVAESAYFPSFADDSVSGYRAWLDDLQSIIEPYFSGSESGFIHLATAYMIEEAKQHERDTQHQNYHAVQEPLLKARARTLFQQRRYAEVMRLEEQIRFPELLSRSERLFFQIARERA